MDANGEQQRVRSATVTAVSDIVQTLELPRAEFEMLVESKIIGEEVVQRMHAVKKKRMEICAMLQHSRVLQRTTLFKDLNADVIRNVIYGMVLRHYDAGMNLVTQGETASELMVIMEGVATV